MDETTHDAATTPDNRPDDPLTDLLRRGARDLLKQAVEAELQTFLDDHAGARLPDGRQAVVRNGCQPERTVQTGLGDVPVQMPKTRDRGLPTHSDPESRRGNGWARRPLSWRWC